MRSLLFVFCFVSTSARADTPLDKPEAIDVDRIETPAGRSELSFDGGAPLAGFGATIAMHWLEKPIELGDLEPVRRRQTLVLGGAFALAQSIVVDARIGAAHQIGDRLGNTLDKYVSTDLRAGVRLRVAGTEHRAVFVRADVGFPTGDDGDFAGDASWSLAWRLIGRITAPADIVLAASAGIRLRGREVQVGDKLVGDEFLAAIGVAVPLPALRPLWCAGGVKLTAEAIAIIGDDVDMREGPSPVEARAGVVTRPTDELTIAVRGGIGLDDEIGSPQFRASIELTYAP